MNARIYKKLASLAIKVGINLQKGQDVVIYISTRQDKLAKILVEECYLSGARTVTVEWKNEDIGKLHYLYQDEKTLKKIEPWIIGKEKYRSKQVPCLIHVLDDDPDILSSLDIEKVSKAMIARRSAIKKYRDIVDNINQWTIIAVPSASWAKKVYPNLKEKEAIKRLWLDIIKCSRLEGDPIKNWDNHIKYLAAKADILNKLDLSYLHYKSSNGTDLKLKLHPLYTFISARETNLRGISFSANIPTEEVFSMPDKYGVDGIVYSSKPLSYNSMLIQDFYLKFENGKVVEAKAKVGQDVLLEILNTDEGSSYLGEVALVPYSSPVNKCGVLFYETLFDENACCHLALGQAFKNNFRNYENMSEEDFKKNNYNDSLIHVDFMIGTSDLQIDGYKKDGTKITIFENGSWAI